MPVSSFKFVSPGVFVNEIDNSQLPQETLGVGPTIIGRLEKGPAMRPVRIGSFSDFVEIFGNPIAGKAGTDTWRYGNYTSPTYAAYAAQAWLRNNNSINVVRLLGTQNPNATAGTLGAGGAAGWELTADYATDDNGGGAYGLFVVPSASAGSAVTGTLAAIWYVQTGSISLTGTLAGTSTQVRGNNALIAANSTTYSEYKSIVVDDSGNSTTLTFNFNPDSDKYIRTVFNTNPILTNANSATSTSRKSYWLGETFDRSFLDVAGTGSTYAFIAPLTDGTKNLAKHRFGMQPAKTGWIFSQDLGVATTYNPTNMQKLFRVVAIDSGEWESKNLKISIDDVKAPTNDFNEYGTFSLLVRLANDTDSNQKVVERYVGLNLNPASPNYIARRIGDRYITWDYTEKRYVEYGNYNNISKYVRIEMNEDVENGNVDPTYLPFGFYGPPRFKAYAINSASLNVVPANVPVSASARSLATSGQFLQFGVNLTASLQFPSLPLRASSSTGLSDPTKAFFGITNEEKFASIHDESYVDHVRTAVADFAGYDVDNSTYQEYSFYFSLDDVSGSVSGGNGFVYLSGSRAAGTSWTAVGGGYRTILDQRYDGFTLPMVGGFDGLQITDSDPFRNSKLSGKTVTNDYAYNTVIRAIDTVADPEAVVTDIICVPGITNAAITDYVLSTCENRADALAVIDLPNVYVPEHENANLSQAARRGSVSATVSDLKARSINSSYGATYYPWVQIRDTINDQNVWVPPSVVSLGALSYGQRTQALWFAPAGFTRGGLSEGRGGVPVLAVSQRLNSRERDSLYEANINPIAQFPAEGIVIFGQKTLQVTPSALDRINVRRLLIYLKREISIISSRLLFDQNVEVTWNRFLSQVNPFLQSVQSNLGLTDYRVILDETTTTPDLVDRNVMYAKIYLKPARAIEFIALDFVITNSGASFAD
jgi:hypothetical protein